MAILVGFFVIAAGLYLGLRDSGSSAAPSGEAAEEVASATALEAQQAAEPFRDQIEQPAAERVSQEELQQKVLAALEQHRASLIEKCWKPAVLEQPDPSLIRYTLRFTFDADGRQIGSGLSEDRETGRPEFTSCFQRNLPPLKLEAIGRRARVVVSFELPGRESRGSRATQGAQPSI